MACRLDGTKPFSEPMRNIFDLTLRSKLQRNFSRNSKVSIQENTFESVLWMGNGGHFVSVSMYQMLIIPCIVFVSLLTGIKCVILILMTSSLMSHKQSVSLFVSPKFSIDTIPMSIRNHSQTILTLRMNQTISTWDKSLPLPCLLLCKQGITNNIRCFL